METSLTPALFIERIVRGRMYAQPYLLAILSALVAIAAFIPQRLQAQERLKFIYSQFTMTNSVTWFAREAGLFERHGLAADLVYVDSTPAVQALTA